ncbi:MAG: TlpA disulfide reductase family protein [Phycisphaerales bacterium]|nr:TlpA disulfide reductase family protein [Phycisphaerales bacterium]
MKITPHPSVFVAALLAAAALSSSICAQSVDPSQIQPIPQPSVEPADQAIVDEARGMLVQVAQAFHDAPVVICSTTVKTESLGSTNELTVESVFGPDGEAVIKSLGSIIVATDGWLNVLDHAIYDRYIRVPLGQGISTGLEGVYGNPFVAGFEVMMREAAPPELWLDMVMMRAIGEPTITGLEVIDSEDGRSHHRVLLGGPMGQGSIHIVENKIVSAEATMKVQVEHGAPPVVWTMKLETDTQFVDVLPEPITFDPGERLPVTERWQLDPIDRNRIFAGQVAPPLRLSDLQGDVVDLAELKGDVVLLCFWTTWAKACQRSLVQMDKVFQATGAGEGQVKVYGVNVMERVEGLEQRTELASRYWAAGRLSIPTLVSPAAAVQTAWGITTLPTQVLISPDGTVAEKWTGFLPEMDKKVRTKIESLLQKSPATSP